MDFQSRLQQSLLQKLWTERQEEYSFDYEEFCDDFADYDIEDLNHELGLETNQDVGNEVRMNLTGKVTLFHGSDEQFTSFDFDEAAHLAIHLGSREQAEQFGDHLYAAELNLTHGIAMDDLGVWGLQSMLRELSRLEILNSDEVEKIYSEDNLGDGQSYLLKQLTGKGYSHIEYVNEVECRGERSIIILSNDFVENLKCIDSPSLKANNSMKMRP
ncbi:hypothetical protein VCHA53O466_50425 [Vibrio chagasii]|nr:hypothetical protein VCHA53O466_50425 [Vibrio chagasii]